MSSSRSILRFDQFCLDAQRHLLTREAQDVALSPHLVDILEHLATRPGAIVTKHALLDRFWPDVHVTENTLTRAIADIRKAIGDDTAMPRYIQTAARRGYRFVANVTSQPDSGNDDPFREIVRGRAALEGLDARKVAEAVSTFEQAVAAMPEYAPARVGLASARLFQYEGTRASNAPQRGWLAQALVHARRACDLDPMLGDAWATLGFALAAAGDVEEARAVSRRATALEPTSWRHQFRLSVASWGEERLRAIARSRSCLISHRPVLAAMLFVARQAFGHAVSAANEGAAAQSRQIAHEGAPFPAIGLHWLRGLLLLRDGRVGLAIQSFVREINELRAEQIYAPEFRANAHIARGFAHLGADHPGAAVDAFGLALETLACQGRALIGLHQALCQMSRAPAAEPLLAQVDGAVEQLAKSQRLSEAALVKAAAEATRGDRDAACTTLHNLLEHAPPGHAGWLIPIDPALAAVRTHPQYPQLVRLLAARAA